MGYTTLAFTTVVVAVGGAEAARLAHRDASGAAAPQPFSMSPVIGGFVLGLFLFAAGIASEYIATLFCYLIIISSLLVNGLSVFAIAK